MSRLDSGGVHSPKTCGINKDNAVWNNNSQFYPIEERDNRHGGIQKGPRWKAERQVRAPLRLSCGNWWNPYQHAHIQTVLSGTLCQFWPLVAWRRDAICSFVCQDHRGRPVVCFPFYFVPVFPLASLFFILSISRCFQETQFSLMSRWSILNVTALQLPPLACGAFSRSQSCRPGLDGWRRRRRSSQTLGFGDLNALQSEPCRVQLERVILLLKPSAAPQMAFVLARDMLGDWVKAAESLTSGESLSSAGKTLRSKWAEKANRCLFCLKSEQWTEKKNRWIRVKKNLHTLQVYTPLEKDWNFWTAR